MMLLEIIVCWGKNNLFPFYQFVGQFQGGAYIKRL